MYLLPSTLQLPLLAPRPHGRGLLRGHRAADQGIPGVPAQRVEDRAAVHTEDSRQDVGCLCGGGHGGHPCRDTLPAGRDGHDAALPEDGPPLHLGKHERLAALPAGTTIISWTRRTTSTGCHRRDEVHRLPVEAGSPELFRGGRPRFPKGVAVRPWSRQAWMRAR